MTTIQGKEIVLGIEDIPIREGAEKYVASSFISLRRASTLRLS